MHDDGSQSTPSTPPPPHDAARIAYHDFVLACRAYLDHHHDAPPHPQQSRKEQLGAQQYAQRWTWCDGAHQHSAHLATPPSGGLTRAANLLVTFSSLAPSHDDDIGLDTDIALLEPVDDDDDDDATAQPTAADDEQPLASHRFVHFKQTIAWSSTWRVPLLYFYAATREGQPLSLDDLLSSSLLHRRGTLDSALDQDRQLTESVAMAKATAPDAPAAFPPLSQGQNPLTGQPCFYLHPCQTAGVLQSVIEPRLAPDERQETWQLAYIESFIMLCATAVEMRL